MQQDTTDSLESLGFTSYEARAYLGLQRRFPQSGYALSKSTGIPRSRIYDTLDRLVEKGVAVKLDSNPVEYLPVSSDELSAQLKASFDGKLAAFEQAIEEIATRKEKQDTLILLGREGITERFESMLDQAQQSIYLSGWEDLGANLRQSLQRAMDRGVAVVYDAAAGQRGSRSVTLRDVFVDTPVFESGQTFRLVVDGQETLFGNAALDASSQAVWSNVPGFVQSVEHSFRLQLLAQGVAGEIRASTFEGLMQSALNAIPYPAQREAQAQRRSIEGQLVKHRAYFDDLEFDELRRQEGLPKLNILSGLRPAV